jgi:hypothetical protein
MQSLLAKFFSEYLVSKILGGFMNLVNFKKLASIGIGICIAIGSSSVVLGQSNSTTLKRPVSFAMDQSSRGKKKYMRECVECHGKDLKGGLNGGAPLRGMAFEKKYFGGMPATVLYAFMSGAMPPNSPGRYSSKVYADLMAYILDRNGIQPGNPLPSDFAGLGELSMNK